MEIHLIKISLEFGGIKIAEHIIHICKKHLTYIAMINGVILGTMCSYFSYFSCIGCENNIRCALPDYQFGLHDKCTECKFKYLCIFIPTKGI